MLLSGGLKVKGKLGSFFLNATQSLGTVEWNVAHLEHRTNFVPIPGGLKLKGKLGTSEESRCG